jgi:hypothetical protein
MAIDEANKEEIGVLLRIADAAAALGESNDDDLHEIMQLAGVDTSRNANSFVPWDDPQIPFECSCGAIIYADTVHTHEDEE